MLGSGIEMRKMRKQTAAPTQARGEKSSAAASADNDADQLSDEASKTERESEVIRGHVFSTRKPSRRSTLSGFDVGFVQELQESNKQARLPRSSSSVVGSSAEHTFAPATPAATAPAPALNSSPWTEVTNEHG